MAQTKVMKCDCDHKFQDKIYKKKRLMNKSGTWKIPCNGV